MPDLKILLIVPKYAYCDEEDYQYAFPTGLAYISAALEQAGIAHDCINLNHFHGSSGKQLESILETNEYDIICTGGLSLIYSNLKEIFTVINNHSPAITSILGGAIITTEPELIFNLLKPTFGVMGEGDVTIVELIRCLEKHQSPSQVSGIIYREKDNIITTPYRPQINEIDTIPFPALEKCGYSEWLGKQGCNYGQYTNFTDNPRLYIILGSRGCPFNCTFCFHYDKFRERSLDNIFAELEPAVLKHKINIVCFDDDCLSLKKDRIFEFCRRFRELRSKVTWEIRFFVQLMVQSVSNEMLDELKSSGCNIISYGFESYSQPVLDSMKSPLKPEQIDFAVEETQKRNMTVQGNFIFGDVAETVETADETLYYWKNHTNAQIALSFIQPYPGSDIYKHCIDSNIISDKINFMEKNIGSESPLNFTRNMSDHEFEKMAGKIYSYRRKYRSYAIPSKQIKTAHNTYRLDFRCPYCNSKMSVKNVFLNKIKYYEIDFACRICGKRIIICNLRERIKLIISDILYSIKNILHTQ